MNSNNYYSKKPLKTRLIQIGALSFIMYILAVLPFFIKRGMPFFYYGDYNVQQIPFYIAAHRALRNGELFWNWNIDLGGSLIGDFSFYLLGSPFFWLTFPLDEVMLQYVMPFLMALKYSVCAITAYVFIRRHVARDESAMIGALLYAFSGFNACNIVFNHFTDAVAFFPLYLYTFDMLMDVDHHKDNYAFYLSGKRFIAFTLMTSLMSVINYYFFFGQVVFLLIYFIVCYIPGNRVRTHVLMFVRAALGGILGCMISGFFLLQAALAVSGNSRINKFILGYDTVSYPSMNMIWDIIKSMVMIPDIIGKGTVFYTSTVKNASLAVYLPLFGLAGVIAYFLKYKLKKDVHKRLLLVCFIMAMIPVLNSSFSMFNEAYYARWFYMPILFMALCTAKIVERGSSKELKKGTLISAILFLLVINIGILPDYGDDGKLVYMSLIENDKIFWRNVVGTGVITVLLIILIFAFPKCIRNFYDLKDKKKKPLKKPFMRLTALLFATVIASYVSLYIVLYNGSGLITDYGKEEWEHQMLNTMPIGLSDEFFRDETDNTATNYDMVWGIGSLHSFISTIPAQIFDFYEGVGNVHRTVETRIPQEKIGLRAIVSARYYMENSTINKEGIFNDGDGITGYYYKESQNGIDIYENANCIPMGFAYDYYLTKSEWEDIDDEEIQDRLLSVVMVVDDEDEGKVIGTMDKLPSGYYEDILPDEIFEKNCNERKETSCNSFEPDTRGFSAQTTNLQKESVLFFSVPNSKGFTATVDGNKAEIIEADYGMMAIKVNAGVHAIRVNYIPQGFYGGIVMSIVGVIIISFYAVIFYKKKEI